MPKLLVLFQSRHPDVVALAEAAAAGAKTVRFAEVDLRRLPVSDAHDSAADAGVKAHRALEHVDQIAPYDGLIVVAGRETAGDSLGEALSAAGGSLVNRVGAVLTPATGEDRRVVLWSGLSAMADRGMILVPIPFADASSADEDLARGLGKRVAEVIGWVTHARSHHHHEHQHADQASHHHHH